MLAILTFAWHHVQNPWWDLTPDIKVLINTVQDKDGYEGTDEYVPIDGDAYEVDQNARKATLDGPGRADIRIISWDAEAKTFNAVVSEPTKLVLKLFNYPAWRVEVNAHVVTAETHEKTGQMIVPVEAGPNEVRVWFVKTWDRVLGGWVSLLFTLLIAAFLYRKKQTGYS